MVNAADYNPAFHFEINGGSTAEQPRSNTVLYVGKRLEAQLDNLRGVSHCLVFIEPDAELDAKIEENNCIVRCEHPAREYGKVAERLFAQRQQRDSRRQMRQMPGGYFMGENVRLGRDILIEPGVCIGHDVVIGEGCRIMAGAVVKHTVMGKNCVIQENAVLGAYGYNTYTDDEGNERWLCSLGGVVLGDDVYVGVFTVVCMGNGNDTVLGDHTKLDNHIHCAHDVRCGKNVEVVAGSVLGGFSTLHDNAFVGINASLRNRVSIGENALVGMGSVVVKDVPPATTVLGNPARPKGQVTQQPQVSAD